MDALILIGKVMFVTAIVAFFTFAFYMCKTHTSRMATVHAQHARMRARAAEVLAQRDRQRQRVNDVFQKWNGWDRPTELIQLDVAANTMVRDPAKWQRALELAGMPLDTPVSVMADLYHETAEKLGYKPYELTDADRRLLRDHGYSIQEPVRPKPASPDVVAPAVDLEEVAS